MGNNRRSLLYSLLFLIVSIPFISCHNSSKAGVKRTGTDPTPKNIIYLIGDGMSFPQITATEYAYGSLTMTSLPHSGMLTTYSNNSKITDSAAGATALATGHKTNNGMLGVLPDGTPVDNITEYASKLGKTTAIIASSQITHATPAGFAIHHKDRGEEFKIAGKLADAGIDLLMGAGYNDYIPKNEGCQRPDDQNLIEEMEKEGYFYIDRVEGLSQAAENRKVIAFLEAKSLAPAPERGDQLVQLTKAALANASQDPDGFFMMIEGSQIDWGGHDNDGNRVVEEVKDFDDVVSTVIDFAKENGRTLVVVTADHETGGLTMPGGEESGQFTYEYTTGGHTALDVPVYSFGPSGELFEGRYDNTGVVKKMFSLWGKDDDNN